MLMTRTRLSTIIFLLSFATTARAADWPQFLGPNRDGQSAETLPDAAWPAGGPTVLFRAEVGRGWAGVVVASGVAYLFERIDDDEVLLALDATTGKERWRYRYRTRYADDFGFDDGPRATPSLSGNTIVLFGAGGELHAVDLTKGTKRWSRNVLTDYAANKGYFGVASSPLIVENQVIVNVGGRGAGVVSFDLNTGKENWKSTNDAAGYSAPIRATILNKAATVVFTRAGLVGLELATGKVLFQHPFRSRLDASVNAATPLVDGNTIFATSSYGTGALLFRPQPDGAIEELWANDKSLSCQYSTPVRVGDFLYGTDGRADFGTGRLRCVEWKTGRVVWSKDKFGCASLIVAGSKILALTESGDLVRFAADSTSYQEQTRANILSGKVRAAPAFANGILYARNETTVVAVGLR